MGIPMHRPASHSGTRKEPEDAEVVSWSHDSSSNICRSGSKLGRIRQRNASKSGHVGYLPATDLSAVALDIIVPGYHGCSSPHGQGWILPSSLTHRGSARTPSTTPGAGQQKSCRILPVCLGNICRIPWSLSSRIKVFLPGCSWTP